MSTTPTNPILDELSKLSPGAQSALLQAHQSVSQAPTATIQPPTGGVKVPAIGQPAYAQPTTALQKPSNAPSMPASDTSSPIPKMTMQMPNLPQTMTPPTLPKPAKGTMAGDLAERQRLMDTGSGISQIHSKIENSEFGQNHPALGKILGWGAQIPLQALDVAGSTLAPRLAMMTPGTELHHLALLKQDNNAIKQDEETEKEKSATAASNAEIPLRQANARKAIAQADNLENPTPKVGITPEEQTYNDLLGQTNPETGKNYTHAEALKAVAQTKQDVKPEKPEGNDFEKYYKDYITENHLPDSAHNRILARGEWGRATQPPERPQREQRQLAIGPDGKVIELSPGVIVPQGTKSISGGISGEKTTMDETRRADLAENMKENISKYRDILKRRPELFGPIAGRVTGMKEVIGTSDPDVAALKAIEEQLGMAMVGAHAMKNAQHVAAAANALVNGRHNSTAAINNALDDAESSVGTFIQDAGREPSGQKTGHGAVHPNADPLGIR